MGSTYSSLLTIRVDIQWHFSCNMTTKSTGTRKLLFPLGPLAEREMLRVTQGQLCLQWGRS